MWKTLTGSVPFLVTSFLLVLPGNTAAIDSGEDGYIVVLKAEKVLSGAKNHAAARAAATTIIENLLLDFGGDLEYLYLHSLFGYSVKSAPVNFLQSLEGNPYVSFVEPNHRIHFNGGSASRTSGIQTPAAWGLDRIDQTYLPLNNQYAYPNQAHGRIAYVVDTGVSEHVEFGSRLIEGFTAFSYGNGTNDCQGHGTHVAGIIGGSTYGVAKSALIAPVRVFDCSGYGSYSTVLAGIDWVYEDITIRYSEFFYYPITAVNLSISVSEQGEAVKLAVDNLEFVNAVPVAAAGNSDEDACQISPAKSGYAITVAASDLNDYRATFFQGGQQVGKSNYGECVNLFAPGQGIESAYIDNPLTPPIPCQPCYGNSITSGPNTATATMSGTSMAAPHVSGAVLIYAYEMAAYGYPTAAQVKANIINDSSTGLIGDAGNQTPNLLLNISSL